MKKEKIKELYEWKKYVEVIYIKNYFIINKN